MVVESLETEGSYVLLKNLKKVKDPTARFNSMKAKDPAARIESIIVKVPSMLLTKSKNLLLKHSLHEDQHVARRRLSATSLRRFMKLQQLKGEVMDTDKHPGRAFSRIAESPCSVIYYICLISCCQLLSSQLITDLPLAHNYFIFYLYPLWDC